MLNPDASVFVPVIAPERLGGFVSGPAGAPPAAASTIKAAPPQPVSLAEFEPSPIFAGAREGKVFRDGPHGLGYYADKRQARAAAVADGSAPASAKKKKKAKKKASGDGLEDGAADGAAGDAAALAASGSDLPATDSLRAGGRPAASAPAPTVNYASAVRMAAANKKAEQNPSPTGRQKASQRMQQEAGPAVEAPSSARGKAADSSRGDAAKPRGAWGKEPAARAVSPPIGRSKGAWGSRELEPPAGSDLHGAERPGPVGKGGRAGARADAAAGAGRGRGRGKGTSGAMTAGDAAAAAAVSHDDEGPSRPKIAGRLWDPSKPEPTQGKPACVKAPGGKGAGSSQSSASRVCYSGDVIEGFGGSAPGALMAVDGPSITGGGGACPAPAAKGPTVGGCWANRAMLDVVRAAPPEGRQLTSEIASVLRQQMEERVAAEAATAPNKKKAKAQKAKAETAAAPAVQSHAPAAKPGKPKPQANVMLSDLFDLAMPTPSAKPAKAGVPSSSKPAVSASASMGRTTGPVTQPLSQGERKAAAKAEALAKARAGADTAVQVSGLGKTQRFGKQKEGPKKVRLSKMKKTILRELMMRHGLLPGADGELAPAAAGAASTTADAVGEGGAAAPAAAALDADVEEEILAKAYEQLYPDGDPEADDDDDDEDADEAGEGDDGDDGADAGEAGEGDDGDDGAEASDEIAAAAKKLSLDEADGANAEADKAAKGGGSKPKEGADDEAEGGGASGDDAEEEEGKAEGSKDTSLRRPDAAFSDPWLIREYVDQLVLPEVNEACSALLQELSRFQERLYLKDPVKANTKKRYLCGLREVTRSLKTNKAKAVIIAHNVERIESENGLDDIVAQLMELSKSRQEWVFDDETKKSTQELVPREDAIPVIYAFTRKKLAKTLKRSVRTSVVAVLNYDGAGEQFAKMVAETKVARQRWQDLMAPWLVAGQPQPERSLVQQSIEGKQQWTDPLLLHARIGMVEE